MVTDLIRVSKQNAQELHVILGISGNTGTFIAKELVQQGYQVRGISQSGRGPVNIETIKADALNVTELSNAVKGASVIYHCLGLPYPQWFTKHPVIMNNLIQAAAANGPATKIVFADNLYAIGKKGALLGPISEQTPELATDKKGILRHELVSLLLEADQKGLIHASIGRASDFFGPNGSNSLFSFSVQPYIIKHKPSKLFANLSRLHSWAYLPDFARSLVILGTDSRANGKIWILPHYPAVSHRAFIESFYKSVGINLPVPVKARSMLILKIASLFNKQIKEYAEMNYQRQADWTVDDSLFRSVFTDWQSTDLTIAFMETFKSYKIQAKVI